MSDPLSSLTKIARYRLYYVDGDTLHIWETTGEEISKWIQTASNSPDPPPFRLYAWMYEEWRRSAWSCKSEKVEEGLQQLKIKFTDDYNKTNEEE